jgi:hypothetical protein
MPPFAALCHDPDLLVTVTVVLTVEAGVAVIKICKVFIIFTTFGEAWLVR